MTTNCPSGQRLLYFFSLLSFGGAVVFIVSLSVRLATADDITAGPNGINSRGLGLNGAGVNIGQVELGRPGERMTLTPDANGEWFWDHGADRNPGTGDAGENDGIRNGTEWFVDLDGSGTYTSGWVNAHPDVEPFDTYVVANNNPPRTPILNSLPPVGPGGPITLNNYRMFNTIPDHQVDSHALQVAGVMIANGATNQGVATGARLYSGAFITTADRIALTTQAVLRAATDLVQPELSAVRSVNHSWGFGPLAAGGNDGNSIRSLTIDYFASRYDSLQVIAGDEAQAPPSHPGSPSDAYNVLNVSMLTDDVGNGTGIYDRYDAGNRFAAAPNNRDTVHLAAPGVNVSMPRLGGTGYATANGTSFAAPHVTATSALLHEYGNDRRFFDPAEWDASARTHQVMKAVLLNSADKLKDDGTIVPRHSLLDMQKTIYTNPTATQTWLNSPAFAQSVDPLDDRIGAGALNASRALTQFAAREHDSNRTSSGSIPVIGWDNAFSLGTDELHDYFFDTPLRNNSFVSITLSWDRIVNLVDGNSNGLYNSGESFAAPPNALADLNLTLLRKDPQSGLYELLEDQSVSFVDSTEHIFHKLSRAGDYAIRVRHSPGGSALSTEFGLAWWAVAVPEPTFGATLVITCVTMLAPLRRRQR